MRAHSLFFLLCVTLLVFSQKVHAQSVTTSQVFVAGYNSASGTFSAAPGSYSMTSAGTAYRTLATVSVDGQAVKVPAVLRMAANAGQYAKNAMRLNPYALAGTLALGYLADHFLEFDPATSRWKRGEGQQATANSCHGQPMPEGFKPCVYIGTAEAYDYEAQNGVTDPCTNQGGIATGVPQESGSKWDFFCALPGSSSGQVTDTDWEILPDPLPIVGPELPYAPYMPMGVPVISPVVIPTTVPVGSPRTAPDGSTYQPMASISPAPNGQATVSRYDQPVTDASGAPVPQPSPIDSPSDYPTQCDEFPNTLGCAEITPPPDDIPLPHEDRLIDLITPVFASTPGYCPADLSASFLGQSVTFSFAPLCEYATSLRPVVIALAWLAAAFTFVGGVRGNG